MSGRNNEFQGIWKKTAVAWYKVLYWHLPGRREEKTTVRVVVSHLSFKYSSGMLLAVAGDLPQHVSEVYQAAVVTSEHLRDLNKYWCEQCLRYNEARRCVRYETLPKLLVLQLKRFSSTFGWVMCSLAWCDHVLLHLRFHFHDTFHILCNSRRKSKSSVCWSLYAAWRLDFGC